MRASLRKDSLSRSTSRIPMDFSTQSFTIPRLECGLAVTRAVAEISGPTYNRALMTRRRGTRMRVIEVRVPELREPQFDNLDRAVSHARHSSSSPLSLKVRGTRVSDVSWMANELVLTLANADGA